MRITSVSLNRLAQLLGAAFLDPPKGHGEDEPSGCDGQCAQRDCTQLQPQGLQAVEKRRRIE